MKLSGSHKFKASSAQVFQAILNPAILQPSIPGCNSLEYIDANSMRMEITLPIPGLKGPYSAVINIENRQEPHDLTLRMIRKGRGGSVDAISNIHLSDEADGALLQYDANAQLEGAIAAANNPIGQGMAKNALATLFKNLDKAIS